MGSRKWRWFWLIAVIAGSALIPPILFGEPRAVKDQIGGNPWRNIILDFQTLLTGMAAIAAASWTVYTMERTDARQEQRHRELVRLAIRADRLRADRAINPQLDDFGDYVDENISQLKLIFSSDENAITEFDAGNREYQVLATTLQAFFDRAPFEQARDLFDGEMAHALARIHYAIQEMTNSWLRAEVYSPPPGMTRAQMTLSDQERSQAVIAWQSAARVTRAQLASLEEFASGFHQGLVKMRKSYDL